MPETPNESRPLEALQEMTSQIWNLSEYADRFIEPDHLTVAMSVEPTDLYLLKFDDQHRLSFLGHKVKPDGEARPESLTFRYKEGESSDYQQTEPGSALLSAVAGVSKVLMELKHRQQAALGQMVEEIFNAEDASLDTKIITNWYDLQAAAYDYEPADPEGLFERPVDFYSLTGTDRYSLSYHQDSRRERSFILIEINPDSGLREVLMYERTSGKVSHAPKPAQERLEGESAKARMAELLSELHDAVEHKTIMAV